MLLTSSSEESYLFKTNSPAELNLPGCSFFSISESIVSNRYTKGSGIRCGNGG
jgi:hypothetical protein